MSCFSVLSFLKNPPPQIIFNTPTQKITVVTDQEECIVNFLNNEFYDFCLLLTPFLLEDLPSNVKQLLPSTYLQFFNQDRVQYPSLVVIYQAEAFLAGATLESQINFLNYVTQISTKLVLAVAQKNLKLLKVATIYDIVQIKKVAGGNEIRIIKGRESQKTVYCTGDFKFCGII